jgi:hypothetical protein
LKAKSNPTSSWNLPYAFNGCQNQLVKEEQMLNKAHSRADSRFLFLSLLFNSNVSNEIILTGNVW